MNLLLSAFPLSQQLETLDSTIATFIPCNKMTRKFHNMIVSLLFELFLILGSKTQSGYALSMDYYARSCPYAEMVVRNCVFRALTQDPSLSGPLLRMHFHDCFVQVHISKPNVNLPQLISFHLHLHNLTPP